MKARYLRDDIEVGGLINVSPGNVHFVDKFRNQSIVPVLCFKVGAIMDIPNAFRYVQMGVCEPADEECEKRANMSPERMAAAIYAYERSNKAIHHTDFKRYDRGELVGYNPDGSDIPGPNAVTFDDVDDADDSGDDDYEEDEE